MRIKRYLAVGNGTKLVEVDTKDIPVKELVRELAEDDVVWISLRRLEDKIRVRYARRTIEFDAAAELVYEFDIKFLGYDEVDELERFLLEQLRKVTMGRLTIRRTFKPW